MKRIISTILIFSFSCLLTYGQVEKQEIIDSIFTYTDSPSEFRLKMLENCENAKIIADQDIEKQKIKIFIIGGIAPAVYSTDLDFEKKYQVSYYDFGDLAAKGECIFNYNAKVFEYLIEKYGKIWKREIRKDVYGLKKWKKKKKKKKPHNSP